MKAIILAALGAAMGLGLCGQVRAEDEKANPVGTWQCEYKIGDQKRTATLTIKKEAVKNEGDKFVGTMDWPDQKDEKIKDPKFKDGKLTFSAVRKFMGNTIPIDYTFTIDGDKLKGKGASEFGGQKQEFDIEGKRDEKADPVGTWTCEYAIGDQKRMSTLTIKKDGDKLAGTMRWADQKEAKLKDLKLKDGDLTFSAERELMDNKFNIEYKLTITGDKLKGKLAVEIGGEKREFDIEAKREKKDK